MITLTQKIIFYLECDAHVINGLTWMHLQDIFTGSIFPMQEGMKPWLDRRDVIKKYPSYLEDGYFVQTRWMNREVYPELNQPHLIELRTTGMATIFAAIEYGHGRSGGFENWFPSDHWNEESGEIELSGMKLNKIFSIRLENAIQVNIQNYFGDGSDPHLTGSAETALLFIVVSHCSGKYIFF